MTHLALRSRIFKDQDVNAAEKIARLVAELGLTQDAFAQRAGLNRNTARRILLHPNKPIRMATLQQCAAALGLTVHELRELPLEHLILRVHQEHAPGDELERLALTRQPQLLQWIENHPELAQRLTKVEMEELLSLQGTGGPLTQEGIDHFVSMILRRRELHRRVDVIAGTEHLDLLEKFVALLFEKTQPYPRTDASPRSRTGAPGIKSFPRTP